MTTPIRCLDLQGPGKPSFWYGGNRLAKSGNCLGFLYEQPPFTVTFSREQCAEIARFAAQALDQDEPAAASEVKRSDGERLRGIHNRIRHELTPAGMADANDVARAERLLYERTASEFAKPYIDELESTKARIAALEASTKKAWQGRDYFQARANEEPSKALLVQLESRISSLVDERAEVLYILINAGIKGPEHGPDLSARVSALIAKHESELARVKAENDELTTANRNMFAALEKEEAETERSDKRVHDLEAENAALRDAATNLALVLESTTEQSAIGVSLAELRKLLAGAT